MKTYLLITYESDVSSYITKKDTWQEALTAYYEYFGTKSYISVEDFAMLISNKTSDEAIKLFNTLQHDYVKFFGVVGEPFICELIDIDN